MGPLQAEGRQVQRCRAGAHWVFKDKRLERMEQRGRAGQRREVRVEGQAGVEDHPTGTHWEVLFYFSRRSNAGQRGVGRRLQQSW